MISRRQFVQGGAASLAMLGLSRFSVGQQAGGDQRPNILFILTDQWRAAAMGYEGDPNVKTPNLDRLYNQSVSFKTAISVHPICTPARASLLTGQYPTTHGTFHNDVPLPMSTKCMGTMFKDAGYDTGWVGKWHVDGHGRQTYIPPDRRRGFDYWKTAECDHNYNHSHYYSGTDQTKKHWDGYDVYAQTADIKQYLRGRQTATKPFMMVLSYGPPHFPHETAPPEYTKLYPAESLKLHPNVPPEMQQVARQESVGYYGHCSAIDQSVGELLTTLDETGLSQNTIVIFTSDHGEMMGSHGIEPHMKKFPYEESARVPLLIRMPGQGSNRVVRTPFSTVDLLPTMLELCGIAPPTSIEGQSLAPLVTNTGPEQDRATLIISISHGKMNCPEYRGIRTTRHTYVRKLDGPWLLFDNEADPYQMRNLINAPEAKELQATLEQRLGQELAKIHDQLRPRDYYLKKWNYPADTTAKEG